MRIDKEYPATHSMSTSWYCVDDDGNVAIVDFNENGPVPWGTPEQSIESLSYGYCENEDTDEYFPFSLTDEQIFDLLGESHVPTYEDDVFECIVEIDKTKEERFLELVKNSDCHMELCLSESLGLYQIDIETMVEDKNGNWIDVECTTWQKMVDEGVISKVYSKKEFFINDVYKDRELKFEKDFDNSPYYIYCQPYWPEFLTTKVSEPAHPVKISQLPTELQRRLIRVRGLFKEITSFQVAEYHPCSMHSSGNGFIVDGCGYDLLPMSDGHKAYVLTDLFADIHVPVDNLFTLTPTVLLIGVEDDMPYKYKVTSDFVIKSSVYIKFPGNLVEFRMTIFKQVLERINPRVIFGVANIPKAFETTFVINDHILHIDGKQYPIFFKEELDKFRSEIERLASMQYQGKRFPYIISEEEMKQLAKDEDENK